MSASYPKSWKRIFLDLATSDPSRGRELDLDFVRGIAILLAMGWHFNNHPTEYLAANIVLWPGRAFGWAGVDLFFVLSGFLVGRLVFQEIRNTGYLRKKEFFIRRAFKLWPTLYFFLFLFSTYEPWRIFLFQIAFHVQNFFRTPVATHLWSLAVEEHFYLVFAFLGPVVLSKLGSPRTFIVTLLALMATVLAFRVFAYSFGVSADVLQVQTQYRIDALACGVSLAVLAVYFPECFGNLLRLRVLWGAIVFLGCVFLAHFPKNSSVGCTIGFTVSYITSAAALLAIYRSGIERLVPWLCRPIALAGVYSYAIYIWHVPAEKILNIYVLRDHLTNQFIIISIDYIGAILAGYVMTRILERPFLAIREYLFPRPGSNCRASSDK